MTGEYVISVYVSTSNAEAVAKSAEILARAVAGLALDGVSASLHVGPAEDDEESA